MNSKKKNAKLGKYAFYERAVQSPDVDVRFLKKTFFSLRQRHALSLREDFCAAFALSCEWVRSHKEHRAISIDLDAEPLNYGRANYISQLNENQKKRITVLNKNVLDPKLPKADIICAMNFSYYVLKTRELLRAYFKSCLRHLPKDGVLVLDCFGGPACHTPNVEKKRKSGFTYFWDQKTWDPITHHAKFAIHFQPLHGRKMNNAFTYDWRMWSIPEIRELLAEAGFAKSVVYWEGTSNDGSGNGIFRSVEHVNEEGTESWVCYIIGLKTT